MNPVPPRSPAPLTLIVVSTLAMLAFASPALAFRTGPSPAFPGCNIWFNDKGLPLRTRQNKPIGEESPCGNSPAREEHFKVVPGLDANTLAIKDDTHHLVCVLQLAPGSTTVIVPKACSKIP